MDRIMSTTSRNGYSTTLVFTIQPTVILHIHQSPVSSFGSGFLFFLFLFGLANPFVVILESDGSHQVGAFPFFDGVGLGEGEELGAVFFGVTGFEGGEGTAEPVHLACRGMTSVNLVLFRLRTGGLVGAGVFRLKHKRILDFCQIGIVGNFPTGLVLLCGSPELGRFGIGERSLNEDVLHIDVSVFLGPFLGGAHASEVEAATRLGSLQFDASVVAAHLFVINAFAFVDGGVFRLHPATHLFPVIVLWLLDRPRFLFGLVAFGTPSNRFAFR